MLNPKIRNSPTAAEQQNNSSSTYDDLLDKSRCATEGYVNCDCSEATYYVKQAGKPKRKRRHRINTGYVKGSKKASDSQSEKDLYNASIVQALSADVISVGSGEERIEGGGSRISAILERSQESDETSDSDSVVKVGGNISSLIGPDLNPQRPTMISFDSQRPTVIVPTIIRHKEVESVSVHKKSGPAPSEDAMSINSRNTATTCSLSTCSSTYSSAKSFQYRPTNHFERAIVELGQSSRRRTVTFSDESVGAARGSSLVSGAFVSTGNYGNDGKTVASFFSGERSDAGDDSPSISGSMVESTLFAEGSTLSSADSFKCRLQPTRHSSLEPLNERYPVDDDAKENDFASCDESSTSSSSEEGVCTTKKALDQYIDSAKPILRSNRSSSSRPRSAQDLEEPSCKERRKNRRPTNPISARSDIQNKGSHIDELDEVEQIMLECGLTGRSGRFDKEEIEKIVQEYLQDNKKNEHTIYKRVTGKLVCLFSSLRFWR